jgi:hypothetical protein
MFIVKIECRVLFAAHEGGAVLELEACLYHRPQHAGLFQVFHALRQQAFADAKARKLFTLEHQHLPALPTQQSSRYRAGRPGANDQDFHRLSIFPFQTIQHHRAIHIVHGSVLYSLWCVGSSLKQGTMNHTVIVPINMVRPNACSAGVLLKLSNPKESKVLNADKPTASQAMASRRLGCSCKKIP